MKNGARSFVLPPSRQAEHKKFNNAGCGDFQYLFSPCFKPWGLRMLLFTAVSAVKREVAKPEPDARFIC